MKQKSAEHGRTAVVEIPMERHDAEIILKAISPEKDDLPRATVALCAGPGGLTLKVTAEDTVALRAALNSYLRWIKVAAEVNKVGTRQ